MNTPRESHNKSIPSNIVEDLQKLLATEPFSRAISQTNTQEQQAFVKQVSTLLHADHKDVLRALCIHLISQEGETQPTMSYIEMYLDEGDISPEIAPHVFQYIMTKISAQKRQNSGISPVNENFSRILNKLEKNESSNADGTIALIQGKVAQVFDKDTQRAIDRYRLALQKNHPQACYLLGAILMENRSQIKGADEECSLLLLRGWLEFQNVNCLTEYIRLSFFLGNDDEGIRYYQILKMVRNNIPHIIEYIPTLSFPNRLPLLVDYLKRHHAGEYSTPIIPDVYNQAIQWIWTHLTELNNQKETLMESMTKLEEKGEDTSGLEMELRGKYSEILDIMEIGAVYLLDDSTTLHYLENILDSLKDKNIKREMLIQHILRSESYACKWMERTRILLEAKYIKNLTGGYMGFKVSQKDRLITSSENKFPGETDDHKKTIKYDIMGLLDMVLYHSMTYHDEEISQLYTKIEAVITNPQRFELDRTYQKIRTEKNIFENMPLRLRDWYSELEDAIDKECSPFVRKKMQGAGRIGDQFIVQGTKNSVLFLIFDGFLSGVNEKMINGYAENLAGVRLTPTEGLNLVALCRHFGYNELAFDLLCDSRVNWNDPEALRLALCIICKFSEGETDIAEELIEQIEASIKGQGHNIDDFQGFITSSLNQQFSEHLENEGILYEISGLGALLFGDTELTTEYLTKSCDLGNKGAMIHLSMMYIWQRNYEKAYQAMKKIYDPEDIEFLHKIPQLADLAIVTDHRHEVPGYMETMKKYNIEESSWIHFYYLITGDGSQELEGMRFLGKYGRDIPEGFDQDVVAMAQERMNALLQDPRSTMYERLSCLRSLALSEADGSSYVFTYWQMLQELVQKKDFSLISRHLQEFVDIPTWEMYQKKTINKDTRLYEQARTGLVLEAMIFNNQRKSDKDFFHIFDILAKTCGLFPEHASLIQDWYKNLQPQITIHDSFDLGYEMGRFGEKVTLH